MLDHLPYLHFLVRTQQGREVGLISPAEVAPDEFAGAFYFVPVRENGSFFPAYRFDFSIYRGKGEFLQPENGKRVFNGMAFAATEGRREVLICTFEYPFGLRPSNGHADMPLWFFEDRPSRTVPVFRKVSSRGKEKRLHYAGSFRHTDFKCPFVEVEPVEPTILDELLEQWGLSIVGCSPTQRYTRRPKRKLIRARG